MFSVSISVYKGDNPCFFEQALDSIFNQTILPDEVILVVDGPVSEDTKKVIKIFNETFDILKVVWLKENVGHGEARRIGLENCSHNIVALMDSDDICVENRFEKQLACFEQDKQLSIVGGQIDEFEGCITNIVAKRLVPLEDKEIKEYLKKRCPMNQMTVMFNKKHVLDAGGYLDWFCNEDYYLWIRMFLNNAKFKNLPDVLVKARVNLALYGRRGGWKYFRSEAKLQKYMKKNNIISMYRYLINVSIRFVIQVLMTNNIRKIVFLKLLR